MDLSSPDINLWTGVAWIIVDVFIRLSFWRHPFTAEHPLLRHWCILQIWSHEDNIYIFNGTFVTCLSSATVSRFILLSFFLDNLDMSFLVSCQTGMDRG